MVLKAIVSSREAYFRLLQLLLVFGLGLVHAGQAWAELTTIKLPLSGGHELEVLIHTPAQAEQPLPAVVIFGGLEAGAGVLNVVAGQAPVVAASFAFRTSRQRNWVGAMPWARWMISGRAWTGPSMASPN